MALGSLDNDDFPTDLGQDLGQSQLVSFLVFSALGVLLWLLCALLAGLTLGICGLNITKLHVLSMMDSKPKKRKRALVLLKIKRHESWFLCSMIISSVACAESIPSIIELLFGTGWVPIVVSTIAIAIFAELLPQYLIPRNAILWGYYCRPLVWGCMYLTCIVSWPLSYFLDLIFGRHPDRGIFTPDQLEILIRFHEQAEKHGGQLGPDASRVMRGALRLDHQTLQGKPQPTYENSVPPLPDVERALPDIKRVGIARPAILVSWSSVRRLGINEEVTKELVLRIKKWSYSRIPVVGNLETGNDESAENSEAWKNQRVYGFLHIKNLVGLELSDEHSHSTKLLVKDLPLYPLPIIRDDMPLYDLLNVFQMGMARLAIVIPRPLEELVSLRATVGNLDSLPLREAPLRVVSKGVVARNTTETIPLDTAVTDWSTDFLKAAQNDIELPQNRKHSIIGISCPKPLGIVSYEDILDAILQKTSRDEKDFFDRGNVIPPTKRKKEGDVKSESDNAITSKGKNPIPISPEIVHSAFEWPDERAYGSDATVRMRKISEAKHKKSEENKRITRRRNLTGPDDGFDGAFEHSRPGFDGANELGTTLSNDAINDRSSYTENTLGGFHDPTGSAESIHHVDLPSLDSKFHSKGRQSAQVRPASLGSSYGAPKRLPSLRRVAPFSKEASATLEKPQAVRRYELATIMKGTPGKIQDGGLPDGSDCKKDLRVHSEGLPSHLHTGNVGTVSKLSFPAKWYSFGLDGAGTLPAATSNTAAIANGSEQKVGKTEALPTCVIPNAPQSEEDRLREESFHDDRTMLPSQRKLGNRNLQS